jgi:hypothetical protein
MPENERLEQLKSLVSNFSANIAEYKSGQYDESNTRTDFIDKFFTLLDWDVANNYVLKSNDKSLSLKFILGILCSKLMTFYARTKYLTTSMRGGYIELRVFEVEILPIPIIDISKNSDKAKHDDLVSLVDKMLEQKEKEADEPNQQLKTMISRQIDSVGKAIDTAVYQLYNLTDDEIKVVEGE